jgi:outer membrane protein OmpA-like peptidoglycan-associated protein
MWDKLTHVVGALYLGNDTRKLAVVTTFSKAVRSIASLTLVAALALQAIPADAQGRESVFRRDTPSQQGKDKGQYIPTISISPDGCEIWVADDGAEGYAENHVNRQGIPVCHDLNVCGVMSSDQFFASNSYRISREGKARLKEFFRTSPAFAYTIIGHTDSRASDEYNMRLSFNRANSVAAVALGLGVRVTDVRGMGERVPVAANNSPAGMAKNRRVEILCYK